MMLARLMVLSFMTLSTRVGALTVEQLRHGSWCHGDLLLRAIMRRDDFSIYVQPVEIEEVH